MFSAVYLECRIMKKTTVHATSDVYLFSATGALSRDKSFGNRGFGRKACELMT